MKDGVASNCDSTKASLESVQDSLSSLTSQFSRLEARLCSSPDPIGTRNATQVSPSSAQISGQFFGCGAVRSIDDAIVKGRCIYCSKDVSSYSSDEVGRHLADITLLVVATLSSGIRHGDCCEFISTQHTVVMFESATMQPFQHFSRIHPHSGTLVTL